MISEIKIDGKDITEVTDFDFAIETPSDERNVYRETTFAAHIKITRDGSDDPNLEGFKLATNTDGKKKLVGGSIKLVDGEDKEAYSITLNSAFVSKWVLNNPDNPSLPTTEKIELRCGDMSLNAGGGGAEFKLGYFR